MPRLPQIRVTALADMVGQLRFIPAKTARRHVERAEAFLLALDPTRAYSEIEIVRRITAYAPQIDDPALIPGEALLSELGAIIERLSLRAGYRTDELAGWPGVDDLRARWRVSRRTIERYRLAGLAGRRARTPPAPVGTGREVLLFSPSLVAWFESRTAPRLARGSAFTRIDPRDADEIVRRARAYHRRLGLSPAQVSRRLGERFGRSPDAIRRLLIRHDDLHAAEAPPIFERITAPTERQRRVIERATRWRGVGLPATLLARRFGLVPAAVHRLALQARADRFRSIASRLPAAPRHAGLDPGALDAALAPPAVRNALGQPAASTIPAFIGRTLAAGWPDPAIEHARATAWHGLRLRAAAHIADLPTHPSAAQIDRIGTDLLWASRLKAELIRAEGMLLLKTVEAQLGSPLSELPDDRAAAVYRTAIEALIGPGEGIDQYDPGKGGRVAAPAGVALNRAISRWAAASRPAAGRATRLAPSVPTALPEWTRAVDPWQAWLEPPAAIRDRVVAGDADDPDPVLVRRRFGWLAGPPTTLVELARERGERPSDLARRLRGIMSRWLDDPAPR